MEMIEDARYRLRLAEGYVAEARQDKDLGRWRSCVSNCQLAAENTAKAALALLGPIGLTHNPGPLLRDALADGLFPEAANDRVQELAAAAEALGPTVHISTDYGDEDARVTPWELFGESQAQDALSLAERALVEARELVEGWVT